MARGGKGDEGREKGRGRERANVRDKGGGKKKVEQDQNDDDARLGCPPADGQS